MSHRGHDERRALAVLGTDRAEDIGRGGSLIFRGARARAALGPAARDLVLLADARLVGEPDFYGGGLDAFFARDLRPGAPGNFLRNYAGAGISLQHVAERLRASSKVGENPGAISVLVIRGAGVGVGYPMSQRVVEQGGDLARSCSHRFGLADACGEPSIEGAQRRLRATDGHCGQPQQRRGSAAGSPRSRRKHFAPRYLVGRRQA